MQNMEARGRGFPTRLILGLVRDGVASEIRCAFGRGIHGVADGGVVRAVKGSALLSRDAGLAGTLFASSDQVL